MTNEVIIRCQKTPEVGIQRIPAYAYIPQYTAGTNQKFGGLGKIWGLCPPGPSLKPPLAVKLFFKYSNLHVCDHGTWTSRTDTETDRQTTYSTTEHNRALRSIVRRAIKTVVYIRSDSDIQ